MLSQWENLNLGDPSEKMMYSKVTLLSQIMRKIDLLNFYSIVHTSGWVAQSQSASLLCQ